MNSRIPRWRLALHDGVDGLQRRRQRRAVVVVVEEVAVQVERVDEVELQHVDEIDAHRPAALDADRMLGEVMADRVDRIDLVLVVEVGVEPVHHHHEFLPLLVLGRAEQAGARDRRLLGMPRRIGIDDEGAVHPLVDVPLQRQRVAVIEVAAERQGVELVDELAAGIDHAGAGNAVHARGMDAVEMHRVRMRSLIRKTMRRRSPSVARKVGPGTRPL